MTKKQVQKSDKIAVAEAKKVYSFWPLHTRKLETALPVTLSCELPETGEKFLVETSLVFLNIRGDEFPNFVSVEFDPDTLRTEAKKAAFLAFRAAFSKLGNTVNLLIDAGNYCVDCYRPVCVSWDYNYATFCFKRGPA
jgi:hypothetical protein